MTIREHSLFPSASSPGLEMLDTDSFSFLITILVLIIHDFKSASYQIKTTTCPKTPKTVKDSIWVIVQHLSCIRMAASIVDRVKDVAPQTKLLSKPSSHRSCHPYHQTSLISPSFHCQGCPKTKALWVVITVLRRPANRPDAQLLESATVV